jgi:hypothetical protein
MRASESLSFIINAMSLWSGVGLGGEWVEPLLAIENAPNKRAWYVSAIRGQ